MTVKVTRDDYLAANRAGIENKDWYYNTPALMVAYNLGSQGFDLSKAPVVTGWRLGKAPDSFISQNHAENKAEPGLSMMAIGDAPEHWSAAFVTDRPRYTYTGILSQTGSDDEPCILCFDAEMMD